MVALGVDWNTDGRYRGYRPIYNGASVSIDGRQYAYDIGDLEPMPPDGPPSDRPTYYFVGEQVRYCGNIERLKGELGVIANVIEGLKSKSYDVRFGEQADATELRTVGDYLELPFSVEEEVEVKLGGTWERGRIIGYTPRTRERWLVRDLQNKWTSRWMATNELRKPSGPRFAAGDKVRYQGSKPVRIVRKGDVGTVVEGPTLTKPRTYRVKFGYDYVWLQEQSMEPAK